MLASGLAAKIFMRKWRSWEVFQGTNLTEDYWSSAKHWFLLLALLIVASFFCLAYYSETNRNSRGYERDLCIHSPTTTTTKPFLMSSLGKPRVMSVLGKQTFKWRYHRPSGNCNLSNWKLTRKKFRDFNGIRTHDLQLSYEDPFIGSRPICWVHLKPWMEWNIGWRWCEPLKY